MNRFHVWIPLFCMVCLIGSISSEPTNLPTEHIANPIHIDTNQQQTPMTYSDDLNSQGLADGETKIMIGASVYIVTNVSNDPKVDSTQLIAIPIEEFNEDAVAKGKKQSPKGL